jgi:hypothetical protein
MDSTIALTRHKDELELIMAMEDVALATPRLDMRRSIGWIKFLTQPEYGRIHHIGSGIEPDVPDLIQKVTR